MLLLRPQLRLLFVCSYLLLPMSIVASITCNMFSIWYVATAHSYWFGLTFVSTQLQLCPSFMCNADIPDVSPDAICLHRERMLDRLRGVYSSGAVIPLPFLSASLAAPAALMADVRESYCEVTPETYPLVCRRLFLCMHLQIPCQSILDDTSVVLHM